MVRRIPQLELPAPAEELEALCRQWKVRTLGVSRSAVHDDASSTRGDIDLMVTFDGSRPHGLRFFKAVDDFSNLFQRDVNLVEVDEGALDPGVHVGNGSVDHDYETIFAAVE